MNVVKLIYPMTPLFGGLLLNWRVLLCLNLGGPPEPPGPEGPAVARIGALLAAFLTSTLPTSGAMTLSCIGVEF